MPLYLTASHSSRIRKPGAKAQLPRRSTLSSFSNLARRKPNQRATPLDNKNHLFDDRLKLDDAGQVIFLSDISPVDGVLQAIRHSHETIFCDIPERAGMNSTRIAETLNFRKGLPSIVSLAHVHALIAGSTRTEREIATVIASGDIRKLTVSGRGNDTSGLSEFLVLAQDLEVCIRSSSLESAVVDKFIGLLRQHPQSTTVSASFFSPSEVTALRDAGFLVSNGISRRSSVPTAAGSRLAPAAISRQPSGTVAAAGGAAASDSLGGIGSVRTSLDSVLTGPATELTLSLPSIGAYLRLVADARAHLLELLKKLQYKEAPLDLIRERWDGAIDSDNRVSNAKRVRGEFAGVLPGRTKKWKKLYGLNFNWVLEECLGAGLVELFDTCSVGHGIRAI